MPEKDASKLNRLKDQKERTDKTGMGDKRPDIFTYLDHRLFLKDQIRFLQKHKKSFNLAQLTGLSQPYISRSNAR